MTHGRVVRGGGVAGGQHLIRECQELVTRLEQKKGNVTIRGDPSTGMLPILYKKTPTLKITLFKFGPTFQNVSNTCYIRPVFSGRAG